MSKSGGTTRASHTERIRPAYAYLGFTAAALMLMLLMGAHVLWSQHEAAGLRTKHAALVRELELTDLCLFTDARYTRHPSMADLHSAFQDHPLAMDHFPSGSIMDPPPHIGSASYFKGVPRNELP